MTEYIEREALLRNWSMCDEPADAYQFVRDFPAADVAEVVRCKDCDFWNEWDEAGHKKTGNYVCSCGYFSNDDGYAVYTRPDDYCSHGERKEG